MTHQNIFQGIRSHVAGSYRTESLHGTEYIVVPVVALVEGVLQGMSSSGPELALASEFAKFPDSWNGRPVVMSHPVNTDGNPISANSPTVLEAYQIGFLFNSKLEGDRLIQEAWVNKTIMSNLNDNSKEILEVLSKGEIIEVSTGYYAEIEPTPGLYANKKYDAVQRNIAPDHLAFLPMGTIGACSNEDGCGAQLAANSTPTKAYEPIKDFRVDSPCCAKCAETGGTCTHEEPHMPNANASMDDEDKGKGKKAKRTKGDPKSYEALSIANTIAGSVTLDDAWSLVCSALRSSGYGTYTYITAMTTTEVVYEVYDNFRGEYVMFAQGYSVAADGTVSLDGNIRQVNLMTKIVAANEQSDGNNASGTGEGDMPNDPTKPGETAPAPQANKEPRVETVTNDQGTLEVNFDAEGKVTGYKLTPTANSAPQTVEEYISRAPKAFQDVMQSSLRLHEESKKHLIAQLKSTNRCKLSDEKLNALSLGDLQELCDLAAIPTFSGRAAPVSANETQESNFTEAPLVFEAPKAA